MNKNILYISILGMSEPLGKSQVLEYVKDLSKEYNMNLYSFEKDLNNNTINELYHTMKENNINWYYQKYSNKYGIFSTIQQIFTSFLEIRKLIKKRNIKVIHARSMIPTVIALILKVFYNVKVIADIRGFQIDEKAEVGRLEKNSPLYKILKNVEQYTYKKSDAIVSLTFNAINYISQYTNKSKISVISTCASNKVFYKIPEDEKKLFKNHLGYRENDIILLHAGAVSNWYDFDNELEIISKLFELNKDIKYLILNKGEHKFIEKKLNEYNIDKNRVKVQEVNFYEMYKYLNISIASIFIIKPTFAKKASAPTKFAENLCCGLFSITNNGIGDMNLFFEKNNTLGYSFEIEDIKTNLNQICKNILIGIKKERKDSEYQDTYIENFSKDMAIVKYSKIYNSLLGLSK